MNKYLFSSGNILLGLKYSIIYRFIIIVYSIGLFFINDSNFILQNFLLQIVIYILIYIYLLYREKHFLRSVVDYTYIIFSLCNYDIFLYYNFVFLLLPFINIPNHTGLNRSPVIVFILSLFSFLILVFLQKQNIEIHIFLSVLFVFGFFLIISRFDIIKQENLEYIFKIYQEIDNSIINQPSRTQVPKVYRMLISELEKKLNIKIDRILCFQSSQQNIELINASKFTLKYDFDFDSFLKTDRRAFKEFNIKIDSIEKNVILNIEIDEYIFLILHTNKSEKISLYDKAFLYSFLQEVFLKLSVIIKFEFGLYEERYSKLKNINNQQHYVLETMQSTHYLTNKLSSIKNYLTFQVDMHSKKRIPENIKKKMIELGDNELIQASRAMKDISKKTNALLDKKENPFIATNHENLKAKRIYMMVLKMLSHEFKNSEFKIQTTLSSNTALERDFNIDIGTMELILVDILANMKKYAKIEKIVSFEFSTELIITFMNDFDCNESSYRHLESIVKSHNDDDRREINRSHNFGLLHIKEQAKQNSICTSLILDENLFKIKLIFEKA